jgi:hypothetical protein
MGVAARTFLLGAVMAAVLALAPAAFAEPAPFGRACVPRDGVRFCPTVDLTQRVPSWDGTPLDVDVTLPPTGDGPFPTILLLHGLGETKTSFQGPATAGAGYTDAGFAQRGYAVITPTARGFGASCGTPESRTAGCERGWVRLADMRYEVRDLQYLAGLLVDQGVVRPDAIGATGVSYGGGMSTMLAYLRDRVRNPDRSLSPWTSPAGRPMSLTAAWPRWLWTNGESIFTRNGRGAWSRTPAGVTVQTYANAIFGVAGRGFVAPSGADLTADISLWKSLIDAGAIGGQAEAVLDNAYINHGVASLAGKPSPLLLQTGWTDALFPVPQALAGYDALLRKDAAAPVAMQIGDLGHIPGANHPRDTAAFTAQGIAFLDAWLQGTAAKPAPGHVTAYTMVCPKASPSGGGPYTAPRYSGLARGTVRFATRRTLAISSKGGSAELAASLSPLSKTGSDLCSTYPADASNRAVLGVRSPGVTMLGLPVITGRVATRGRNGQLDARVWDRDARGRQRLITRGTYRLTDNQRGRFRFQLDGNGWRFARGHRIVVELLGRDAPTYGAGPTAFSAKLSDVSVAVPVREKPSRRTGITKR